MTSSMHFYDGHHVFRNQPQYTHFDRPFTEGVDMLFCCVNEIDPYFLEQENAEIEDAAFAFNTFIDPRTKTAVSETFIDHTVPRVYKMFSSPKNSLLQKDEHIACLHVLKAVQEKSDITLAQASVLKKVSSKREKERIEFSKFLLSYSSANYEKIFAPARVLVDLYKFWFKNKAKLLMRQNKNYIFQVHTGLPSPRSCASEDLNGEILNMRILEQHGALALWNYEIQIMRIKPRIETFFEKYCNSVNEEVRTRSEVLKKEICDTQFVIPAESLLFLMCVGDYVDSPTEVLITICSRESQCLDEQPSNFVEFQTPLPSRNCGTNTNLFIAESVVHSFLSLSDDIVRLELRNGFYNPQERIPCQKLDDMPNNQPSYNIKEFDAFMEDLNSNQYVSTYNSHTGFTSFKWTLQLKPTDREIKISTDIPLPIAIDAKKNKITGIHSLKLEYKPQFGCEYATKVELLREWIWLKFFSPDGILKRHRIDVSNFITQLEEQSTLNAIEEELKSVYHTEISRLLGNIGEFLTLLSKVPTGQYMLRYNPKFKDKLMLCAPTKEATIKTIALHSIFQEEVSDLPFMTSRLILPISSNLCSIIHECQQVIPCAFPPKPYNGRNESNDKKFRPRFIDDKPFIMAKIRKKNELLFEKEQQRIALAKSSKRSKKAAKRKAKAAQIKSEKAESDELQKDIEIDKIYYEFQMESHS